MEAKKKPAKKDKTESNINDFAVDDHVKVNSGLFASLALLAPICPVLVRETSETPSEGTNLAGHG